MKYKYFGTAAGEGIPAPWCNCPVCEKARRLGGKNIMSRSQQLIDDKILIDFPPDTFMHTLQGLPLTDIHTCIITHSHNDHLYPADIVTRLPELAYPKDDTPIDIYSTAPSKEAISKALGGAAQSRINLHEITPYVPFSTEGYTITPLKASHPSAPAPVMYIIEKGGKHVFHTHDSGYFLEETWEYLEKNPFHIDFITFDSTETGRYLDEDKMSYHMNLPTVETTRDRLRDLGLIDDRTICVVNHFSHNGQYIYDELAEIMKYHGFVTSYDGLEIEF